MKQLPLNIKKWFRGGLSIVLLCTLVSSGLILFSSLRSGQNIPFNQLDYRALILALLALIASWFIEACRIRLIASGLGEKISLAKIFNINLASAFIGNITPFASGGVPTQIYLLCQAGIQPGKSSAIVTLRVILSTLFFTVLAPLVLIFYHTTFSFGLLHKITTIAIPVSVLISLMLITFIVRPKLAKSLICFPLQKLQARTNRFGFQARIEPYLNKFLTEVETFHQSIRTFRKGWNFFLVILATFAYWACFFTIAPFLIYAFGLNAEGVFLKSILIQFILLFVIAYIPVPGGSGIMELGFFSMFVFIPAQIRAIILLLWRLLSYHLATFVGGIILLRLLNRPVRQPSEGVQG